MATIYREILVNAKPALVWDAIKDVGAVHKRLARGFVKDTVLSGDERTVTFANGYVARERIVSIDDDLRRVVYALVGDKVTHHSASFQVLDVPGGQTRLLWFTDLLPDEASPMIEQMVERGSEAIRETLEATATADRSA